MKIVADMHCHTVASAHAYSTIQECAAAARMRGIELLAITDHGGSIPDAPHEWHFWNLRVVPEVIDGVRILKGVEANIINYDGHIDVDEKILDSLDIVIASFHPPCCGPGKVGENTKAVINALKNPYVDILGHPDNPMYCVDVDEVTAAAREYGKLIELNNKSPMVRRGCEPIAAEFAQKAKKYGTELVCGSDAHISFEVGVFDEVNRIIEQVGLPEDLVLNTSVEKILDYMKNRKRS